MSDRGDLLATVAVLLPYPSTDDCVLVGVDGLDGAGKTTFADDLAQQVQRDGRPTIRVSVDDFHHVREIRHRRGRASAAGFLLDSFDYPRLVSDVLEPLGPSGSRRYSPLAHDLAADRVLEPVWHDAPPGAVVLVDGLFLHRAGLRERWHVSVFLDVPAGERERRMLARDGDLGPRERYLAAGRLYLRDSDPARRATLLIDNSAPR